MDEYLPIDFRHSFPEHEAHTSEWAGFKGVKNGNLLRAVEAAGYDVLLTVDQGIPFQQNQEGRRLTVFVLPTPTNRLEDVQPLAKAILQALATVRPGQFIEIPATD